MFPSFSALRHVVSTCIDNKDEQGFDISGLKEEFGSLPDSYDKLFAFSQKLTTLPYRSDWAYVEPDSLDEIKRECRFTAGYIGAEPISETAAAKQVEAGFLGSVCGCILGKPLEIDPTLAEIRRAAETCGSWPINDYIDERMLKALNRRHSSWVETVRGKISYVADDDDINYTLIGMLLLEMHGVNFTYDNIMYTWLRTLPIVKTFGPERTSLLKAGMGLSGPKTAPPHEEWVTFLQPHTEYCGAVIRADAYGYACPGRPDVAATLAWRDASWTHRKNGIYGTMFTAAAIAIAHVVKDPVAVFTTALDYIPRKSRLHAIITDSIEKVSAAGDWIEGYTSIHNKYRQYTHCRIYQEIGTLVNTLRFAQNIGDGICKQVSQGNDTDSFGATAGSLLGVFFGPGHLEQRWLEPFNDTIHTSLAGFHELSLSRLAQRISRLPVIVAESMKSTVAPEQKEELVLGAAAGI